MVEVLVLSCMFIEDGKGVLKLLKDGIEILYSETFSARTVLKLLEFKLKLGL